MMQPQPVQPERSDRGQARLSWRDSPSALPVLAVADVGLGEAEVSFTAHAGEVVHVGGGTPLARLRLLAMAAGLAPAGSGRFELMGHALQALDAPRRQALRERFVARAIGCDALPRAATVQAALALPLVRRGLAVADALARAALELDALGGLHLAARAPAALTPAETRLALLARATAQRPRLLVIEQPEAGLAEAGVAALRVALWTLSSCYETCVVMTSAHPRLIAGADRHVDLDGGARRLPQ